MAHQKVVHLTTVDLSLRYLLLAQLRAGRDAGDEVIGISAPGPDVAALEAEGIRHVPLPSSTRAMDLRADLRAARELWRILRRERPDVLHTHNPKPGIYGRVLGRLAGVPWVVHTTHGLYATTDDGWARRAVVYLLEAVAGRFSHVELVQNPEDLELMARWRLAPPRKLRLLGNGVDLERFRPLVGGGGADHDDRRGLRAEWGIGEHDVLVGTVARMVAEKGIPELVAAAARAGPPIRLVLVGPEDPDKADALPPGLLDDARRAGVVVAGMRTDVERCYHAMDVFCLASHREGFPRAAMEAAASGLPVVVTDIRGGRQVVDHGATGRLVPVGDAAAMAAAFAELVDAETRAAWGAAARAKAEREFDERRVVARVLASYVR